MSKELLITGMPRSGTYYMYEVFKSLGFRSEHEVAYSLERQPSWEGVEVSWMAVPYLKELDPDETFIVHLIREPLAVLKSIVNYRLLSDSPYKHWRDFVQKHMQFDDDEVASWEAMAQWYLSWNMQAHNAAHMTVRIEDINHTVLRTIVERSLLPDVGIVRTWEYISKNINAAQAKVIPSLLWEDIEERVHYDTFRRLKAMAVNHGYV